MTPSQLKRIIEPRSEKLSELAFLTGACLVPREARACGQWDLILPPAPAWCEHVTDAQLLTLYEVERRHSIVLPRSRCAGFWRTRSGETRPRCREPSQLRRAVDLTGFRKSKPCT